MKKISILLLIIAISFVTSGCMVGEGSSGVSMGDGKFDLEYENIEVEETHDFIMNKGDYFKVLTKKNKGRIKISIVDSKGNELYSGNNLPTSEFTIEVLNDDIYTINVYGRRVTGELSFRRIENR